MLEQGRSEHSSRVEVTSVASQGTPFEVRRTDSGWQLTVNKGYFLGKGFTPDEIEGAAYLEQERLRKQTIADNVDAVKGLHKWQELANDPKVSAYKAVFERVAALSSLKRQDPEKATLARRFLEKFAQRSPSQSSVDQLFGQVLKRGLGQEPTS